MRMSYSELLDFFAAPESPSVLTPDLTAACARGIELTPETPTFFFPPALKTESGSLDPVSFWMISAPAAVGKSTVARALAADLLNRKIQVVYIPLRGATIGDNFFGGLLAAIFPKKSKEEVIASLAAGKTVLIFDGYDELTMTDEQSRRNRTFVEEVHRELQSMSRPVRHPAVIFLYRTAIRSLGFFEPLAANGQELELQYFSDEEQVEFLASALARRKRNFHTKVCGEFMAGLKGRLVPISSDSQMAFFGHAPVLLALADLIAEEESLNLKALAESLLRDSVDISEGIDLIERIMDHLLEREGGKLAPDFLIPYGCNDVVVYSPDLQERLLVGLVEHRIARGAYSVEGISGVVRAECVSVLSQCPGFDSLDPARQDEAVNRYSEEIEAKLQTHPFLSSGPDKLLFSNPLYEERFLSAYLSGGRTGQEVNQVFTIYPSPSYYLAEFVLRRMEDRNVASLPSLLFYLLRSLAMAAGEDFSVNIDGSEDGWTVRVSVPTLKVDPFKVSGPILEILVPSGDPLERLNVFGSGEVLVMIRASGGGGSYERRLTLAQVAVEAPEIELDATHVLFAGTVLQGRRIILSPEVGEIEGFESLTFDGEIDASEHVAKRYGAHLRASDEEDRAFLKKRVTQTLTWFRKHKAKEYAIYGERYKTVVLRKGQSLEMDKVDQFLRELGILRDDGEMVVLVQDGLARYGIFYRKQNQIEFGEGFEALVSAWREFAAEGATRPYRKS